MVVVMVCVCVLYSVGHSMPNGPKFQSLGHDTYQILMKLFQMKDIYKIRLSWKFKHKRIIRWKVMTLQSCDSMLKINKNWGGQAAWVHFWVSITFFVLDPQFWNLLHCFCARRTLRWAKVCDFEIVWKSVVAPYQ